MPTTNKTFPKSVRVGGLWKADPERSQPGDILTGMLKVDGNDVRVRLVANSQKSQEKHPDFTLFDGDKKVASLWKYTGDSPKGPKLTGLYSKSKDADGIRLKVFTNGFKDQPQKPDFTVYSEEGVASKEQGIITAPTPVAAPKSAFPF